MTIRRLITTLLSFGLNLGLERLGGDPRWTRLVWVLIALNEIRGLAVVYQIGGTALHAVLSRKGT